MCPPSSGTATLPDDPLVQRWLNFRAATLPGVMLPDTSMDDLWKEWGCPPYSRPESVFKTGQDYPIPGGTHEAGYGSMVLGEAVIQATPLANLEKLDSPSLPERVLFGEAIQLVDLKTTAVADQVDVELLWAARSRHQILIRGCLSARERPAADSDGRWDTLAR